MAQVVSAKAQWQGQQYPSLCPSGSTVMRKPHNVDLMLLSPQRWGAIIIVIVIGDVPEHMTVTGGLVVVAVTGNIMRNTLQRKSIHHINFLCL